MRGGSEGGEGGGGGDQSVRVGGGEGYERVPLSCVRNKFEGNSFSISYKRGLKRQQEKYKMQDWQGFGSLPPPLVASLVIWTTVVSCVGNQFWATNEEFQYILGEAGDGTDN